MFHSPVLKRYAQDFPRLNIRKNPSLPKEGFRIHIENGVPVRLESSDDAGTFYGLIQLRNRHGVYPEGVFEDAPALAFRGFHFTMDATGNSAAFPTFERMKELIVQLAEWRYNTLVFEYDDHFPWKKHADIVNPVSWSADQLKELIRLAESYFIEVIPLLDSLGHAVSYLKHESYRHLAETPDNRTEMCASNPETLKFMEELWDEVLAFHPNARFAHISGDEVYPADRYCPQCRLYAEKGRLGELYGNYYTELSRFILRRGKRPIIWGDMLLKYPDALEKFPRDVTICDWEYSAYDSERWDFNILKYTPEHTAPPEREALFRNALDARPDGTFRAYPSEAFFREQGFSVIGSSSSSIGEYGSFPIPWQSRCVRNQRTMSKAVLDNGNLGLLNTCWSQSLESCLFSIMAGGEYAWNPIGNRDAEILRRFNSEVLHLDSDRRSPIPALDIIQQYLYGEREDFPIDPAVLSVVPRNNAHRILLESVRLGLLDCERHFRNSSRIAGREIRNCRQVDLAPAAPMQFQALQDAIPSHWPLSFEPEEYTLGGIKMKLDSDRALRISDRTKLAVPLSGKASEFEIAGCGCFVEHQKTVISVTVSYADGTSKTMPLAGGRDVPDWFRHRMAGEHFTTFLPMLLGHDIPVQASLTILENPYPEKELRSITFCGADNGRTAFVVLALVLADALRIASPEPMDSDVIHGIADALRDTLETCTIAGKLDKLVHHRVIAPRLA